VNEEDFRRLRHAYRATEYRACEDGVELVLRIDEPCEALAGLHARLGVATSAFLTAWNPGSVETSYEVNAAANARLRAALEGLGLRCFEGAGVGAGGWSEASFLVPGIGHDEAVRLGRAYDQIAIVFAAADAVPRLVFMQTGPAGGRSRRSSR